MRRIQVSLAGLIFRIIVLLEDLEIYRRGLRHALLKQALDAGVARNEVHRTSV